MSVLAYVWHCLCGVDEGGEDYGDGVDDRVGKSAWKNRSQRGNRSRERERERERGAAGANWEGGAERWDGGRFLPARKIFWGVYVSKSNFSEHFLDNIRSPVPSVAILENILHFHQTNAHGPSLCILEKMFDL